jgi:hypothetical protein
VFQIQFGKEEKFKFELQEISNQSLLTEFQLAEVHSIL